MNAPVAGSHFGSKSDIDAAGADIHALAAEIYPICRSITGDGVRQTLDILARHIPLTITEIPSGTPLFDWNAPQEWSIRKAWIKNEQGVKIVDFARHNLHVVNYSMPVSRVMAFEELAGHIHTLPDQPELIPYRTIYYAENWGFCMSHQDFEKLKPGSYEVYIDAERFPGHLTYGEYILEGATDREFLLSAHICHPSLANDNCSGLALLTILARQMASLPNLRHTYRFIFAPGTIGALAWLSQNEDGLDRIDHGLVVSCVGDGGGPTYKRSRRGNAFIDRAMAIALRDLAPEASLLDFSPYGYDERQYCSPGFNLPVGLFQRSLFATFPEYHTSADNLDFIRPKHLARSWQIVSYVIDIAEKDWTPINLSPRGEPQLGRRGLYAAMGGDKRTGEKAMALLWVLNLADGDNSLLAMAERSGMSFFDIADAARRLKEAGLLAEAYVPV